MADDFVDVPADAVVAEMRVRLRRIIEVEKDRGAAQHLWGQISTTPIPPNEQGVPACVDEALNHGYNGYLDYLTAETQQVMGQLPFAVNQFINRERKPGGVVAAVRERIIAAIVKLDADGLADVKKKAPGVIGFQRTSTFRARPGGQASIGHFLGTCIDLPSTTSPYVLNEAEDGAPANQLWAQTYHQIARITRPANPPPLHPSERATRDYSVIPLLAVPESSRGEFTDVPRLYDALVAESDLFTPYFSCMRMRADDVLTWAIDRAKDTDSPINRSDDPVAMHEMAKAQKKQIVDLAFELTQDVSLTVFDELTQTHVVRVAPPPPPYAPDPKKKTLIKPDRPFKGLSPERGFMTMLPRNFVLYMRDAGLAWGGTDMDKASGDLMHFQLYPVNILVKWVKGIISDLAYPPKPKPTP